MNREKIMVDGVRFWAAAMVSALIAGLVAMVIFWLVTDVVEVDLVVRDLPEGTSIQFLTAARTFATSFLAAILAAAVLHLMLRFVVQPSLFFGVLAVVVLAIGVIVPFTIDVPTESQVWLVVLHTIVGVVILSLLLGTVPLVTRVVRA